MTINLTCHRCGAVLVADTEDELVDLGQAHAVEHGHTPPPTREQVLTRALGAAGITVFEVNRPDRANRRRKGKMTPSTPRRLPALSWPDRPPRYPRTATEPSNPCVR